jgi:hypothetical protein
MVSVCPSFTNTNPSRIYTLSFVHVVVPVPSPISFMVLISSTGVFHLRHPKKNKGKNKVKLTDFKMI